tara:strand:- start:1131 stop:1748 length:618 start_codon:yes stop_codon:yes gene_type:complete
VKKIFVFGDSVSFGELVSSNKSWPSLLASYFDTSKNKIIVQNFSKNGDTTRLALLRLEFDILKRKPEIVIIQFGLNDCNIWTSEFENSRVNIISFENNLIEICKKIYSSGAKKVFLNTNHPTLKKSNFNYQNQSINYNKSIRNAFDKLKQEYNINLIDIESKFNNELFKDSNFIKKSLLDDGIHLSEFGQIKYYEIIIEEIKSIL